MSVIIRLQNLPWSANAMDIRQFFNGLSIPQGGVHIVGGEMGDAFIAFSTDEDARQAFQLNGERLKEVQVKLLLSSRAEMQKVIEEARTAPTPFMLTTPVAPLTSDATLAHTLEWETKKQQPTRRRSTSRGKEPPRRRRSRSTERRNRYDDRRRRSPGPARSRDRSRDRGYKSRSGSRDRKRNSRDRNSRERNSRERNNRDRDTRDRNGGRSRGAGRDMERMGVRNNGDASMWTRMNQKPGSFDPVLVNEAARIDAQRTINALGPNLKAAQNLLKAAAHQPWHLNNAFLANAMGVVPPLLETICAPPDALKQRGNCVRVFGDLTNMDIRRAFNGLTIPRDGVKLVRDQFGVARMAMVLFATPVMQMEALRRDGTIVRGVPMRLEPATQQEFDAFVNSPRFDQLAKQRADNRNDSDSALSPKAANEPNPSRTCVIACELPPFTKEHDIIQLIGDLAVKGILMVVDSSGKQAAYVHFSSAHDAQAFAADAAKHEINEQTIRVRVASEHVFHEAKRQHNAGKAVDIDEEQMNADMSNGKLSQESESNAAETSLSSSTSGKDAVISDCMILRNLPAKTTDRDIIDFFSDIGISPKRIHIPSTRTTSTIDCFCEFFDDHEADKALAKNKTYMGPSLVTCELILRRDMEAMGVPPAPPDDDRKRELPLLGPPISPRAANFNNKKDLNSRRRANDEEDDELPPAFRYPLCVMVAENIPFRAGVDEILDFFHGFRLQPEHVLRRYNDRNQPTGEARIAFESPSECQRALKTRHRGKIRDRIIYLTMLPSQ